MFLIFNRTAGFVNYLFAFLILLFYSCGFDIETRPKKTIEPGDHFIISLDPDLRFGFNHLETHFIIENTEAEKIDVNSIALTIFDSSGWERNVRVNDYEGDGEYILFARDLEPDKTYFITAYAELYSFYFKKPNIRIIYSDTLSFRTDPSPGIEQVSDIDGNIYPVVQIGQQFWLARDLRSHRFSNGERIDTLVGIDCGPDSSALTRTSDRGQTYRTSRRKIYNYYATEDDRNICPDGWRVPSVSDIQELAEFLGGWETAGAQLKSVHGWASPNENATNLYGFSALPNPQLNLCPHVWNLFAEFPLWNHNYIKFWVLPDDTTQKDFVYGMGMWNRSDSLFLWKNPALEAIYIKNKNKMNCVRCIKK